MTHKYRYAQAVPLTWALGRRPCTGLTHAWSECAVTPPLPDAMTVITSSSTCPPAEGCEQLPILCSSDPSIPTRGPPMTQAGGAGCREGPAWLPCSHVGSASGPTPGRPGALAPAALRMISLSPSARETANTGSTGTAGLRLGLQCQQATQSSLDRAPPTLVTGRWEQLALAQLPALAFLQAAA